MIIGLLGRKGVGKNFVGNCLAQVVQKEFRNFDFQLAFADPMKAFLVDALGLDRALVYGSDKDKNKPTKYTWEQMPEFVKVHFPGKAGPMTIRHVNQVFGTELCRNIWGQDIWIEAMARRVVECQRKVVKSTVIITDVRFPDEALAIRKWGGSIWRVEGPARGDEAEFNDLHSSESQIDGISHDEVVDNGPAANCQSITAQIYGLLNHFNAQGK